ncbi:unnamed protein product [Spirodela intermedia]|uniref:Pinin/SDK/MemA protein domain-containing protein n=1 Tax=Spirodela intermedia TaxID=51605 RepID=A0A7I8J6C2_SPIIN|nr:unnamed protein product [Spirodela intermedia]CAA6664992.1 unnamed protein product [Spirodela intermedia]
MASATTAGTPAVVEKTAEEIRKEIDELHRQQREITERLRDPRGLRRAGLAQNGPRSIAGADRADNEDLPPAKRRLSSAVVKVGGGESEDLNHGENHAKNQDAETAADEGAVVSNTDDNSYRRMTMAGPQGTDGFRRHGNQRFSRVDYSVPTSEHVPRVLPKDEDPSLVKRNRRMLGQLLGTLEKFQEEDRKLSASEAYLRRSDSLQRAEQRAKEESERLRQQEREELAMKRRRDLVSSLTHSNHLCFSYCGQSRGKKVRTSFIRWSEHHKRLCNFLRTKTEPPIYYLPAKPLEDDSNTADERKQQAFLDWKTSRRAELTEFQKQIGEQYLANIEVELERWQNAGSARRSALENLQETMDKELETHQLEHGPKTRRVPGGGADEEDDVDDIAAEDDPMDDVLGVGESRVAADGGDVPPKSDAAGNGSPSPQDAPVD